MTNVDNTADGYISLPPGAPSSAATSSAYTTPPSEGGLSIGSIGGGYDPNNSAYGAPPTAVNGVVTGATDFTAQQQAQNLLSPGYNSASGTGSSTAGAYDPSVASLIDPSNARLGASGLNIGGAMSAPPISPSISYQKIIGTGGAAIPAEDDWRVRVSLADGAQIFYKDPSGTNQIMSPLIPTNGVIFPYTPQITVEHDASYSPVSPTHSNYPIPFYQNSQVADITVSGDFSVQSISEGQYLMAAVYFFRSATKMFFGKGTNVGNPPPIVFLDGYGDHYFPHVPCVISSFQHTLSAEVDYMEVPISSSTIQNPNFPSLLDGSAQQYTASSPYGTTYTNGPTAPNYNTNSTQTLVTTTRVPTVSTIQITLKPVYSRDSLHNRFDLNKFAAGQLLQDRTRGYGGFL